jgi:hypothetical protein
MGTPFNDQWVLLRSPRRRRSGRTRSRGHVDATAPAAPVTNDERRSAAGNGQLRRRPRWIDRDT